MAREIYINSKIYPSDYRKPYGSLGIKLPMNGTRYTDKDGMFNVSYTTEEQAISNLINLLLTRSGERYMQPSFGVGLYYYIFEQNTDVVRIELDGIIREQVAIWMPYIFLDDVTVNSDFNTDDNAINIVIKFKVNEGGANRTITAFTDSEANLNIEVL